MNPQDYVQQKAAASGSSFYYAFLFLPPERRAAITAFYAFCREVDDVVDEVHDPGVAATMFETLAANGFAADPYRAVFAYNHSDDYVRAVQDYAAVLAADPAAFAGYYNWDVYCKTTAGDVLLPIGYAASAPIPAAEYVASHPQ